jgi:hypothetical protein
MSSMTGLFSAASFSQLHEIITRSIVTDVGPINLKWVEGLDFIDNLWVIQANLSHFESATYFIALHLLLQSINKICYVNVY